MILNGQVLGKPLIEYRDTKTNIEALSGLVEGMGAYATDTNEFGTYDGATWTWLTNSSGSFIPVIHGINGAYHNGFPLTISNGGTGLAGLITQLLVGGGSGIDPVWTTATGTGAPVRAGSPTIVTPTIASLANAQHTHYDAAGGGANIVVAAAEPSPMHAGQIWVDTDA